MSPAQSRVAQAGSMQEGIAQMGTAEICAVEVSLAEIRVVQPGAREEDIVLGPSLYSNRGRRFPPCPFSSRIIPCALRFFGTNLGTSFGQP